MTLFRYIMLPFSLIGATFFGYDQIAAKWHGSELRSALLRGARDDSPEMLRMQPIERVRNALRTEAERARRRGEAYVYEVNPTPGRIEVAVRADYRTKISHYMGKPTLPVDFKIVFDLDR